MNAPLSPALLQRMVAGTDARPESPEATRPGLPGPPHEAGGGPAQRHVWHSRFGTIVIEVQGGEIRVNGQPVAPHSR